ncbi:MAG: 3'-5' exonuclease [Deltaproteobacteria bacterium]|nr:3'-5' exonuclease [Deltaproteobacteria bacterium]MBW2136011.1 3'-5' exonuclease [Deltaproteobacteria bacterium]
MVPLLLARLRNRWTRIRVGGKDLPPVARENLRALDHLDLDQDIIKQRYVVFDLETTGLRLSRDRVLSVAACRIIDGRIPLGDMFSSLANPGRDIPASSIKIHGIVPSMVADAPPLKEVFDGFLTYLGSDILVGYHVNFDLHFLNRYMKQGFGFPLQNLVLDTRRLYCKTVFPAHLKAYAYRFTRNHDLDEAARRLGIKIPGRHTAAGDALATAMIFQQILARFRQRGQHRLRDLIRIGTKM